MGISLNSRHGQGYYIWKTPSLKDVTFENKVQAIQFVIFTFQRQLRMNGSHCWYT